MEQIIPILIQLGAIPFITAGIRALWALFLKVPMPFWMSPFRSLLAGFITSAIAKKSGVEVPSDLTTLTDPTTIMLLNSVADGSLGHLFNSFIDNLVKSHPDNGIVKWLAKIFLRGVAQPEAPK